MFMNDVKKRDEIRNAVLEDLRGFGIKFRPKKHRHNVQESRIGRRVFKTSLHLLPMETVTLSSGQQLMVPRVVHELCSFITTKVITEGLFRKAGSKARQNEIRLSLDAGCCLDDNYHEIDVANVLKTFFRELPEPLFPQVYHELFLRCVLLQKNKLEAILLSCLLLPSEHLNTLAYFMQFLYHVTEHSTLNKMDAYNLAVVIGPTIFPLEEKVTANANLRLSKTCELFKLLIENANNVGFISVNIIDRIAPLPGGANSATSDEEPVNNKKKKKRRSGSLTRVFNGLKKIVGSSKSVSDTPPEATAPPDLLTTPNLTKSSKKRKMEPTGFSNKKKRELLQNLPQGTALRTPVSVHPNAKKFSPPSSACNTNHCMTREKKSQWNLGSKRNKLTKQNKDVHLTSSNAFAETKSALERRWSAVSQAAGFKRNRKARYSCDPDMTQPKKPETNIPSGVEPQTEPICDCEEEKQEPDYMKISRTEYEEIKNRVSAIEHRLSIELNNLESEVDENHKQTSKNLDGIMDVQSAYEETLVKAEPLSPTTDQLARRLSKELKIRRSSEHKVIRSPSARKIGSVRRRSRENDRQNARVQRNQSWHVESVNVPKINLKRGRPNTLFTGLRHPSPLKDTACVVVTPTRGASLPSNGASPSSANNCEQIISQTSFNTSEHSNSLISEKWTSADGFFHRLNTPASNDNFANCRSSIAKLRSQNAGMVLAKARLFDGLIDSDNSGNSQNSFVIPRTKVGQHKIGSIRNLDRNAHKRYDDKNLTRKSTSPRKRNLKSPNKLGIPLRLSFNEKENQFYTDNFNNLDILGNTEKTPLSVLKDCNRIDLTDARTKVVSPGYVTPRGMPQIKRSLTIKSPKRLCRTPMGFDNKQTPLKVVSSSKHVY